LSQSWHQSDTAVKDLSLLPAEKFGLDYINQFLNQVGEFARVLTQQIAKGDSISNDQEQMLSGMHDRLITVNRDVQQLYVDMNTENIAWLDESPGLASWPNVNRAGRAAPASAQGEEGKAESPGSIRSGLEQLDASLQKLPPFSYSGQTDTHTVPEPLGLPKTVVNRDEAAAIASDFLSTVGYPDATPEDAGTSSGPFPGYIFQYKDATVDVCKNGGVVTLYRDERSLGLQQLDANQAAAQGMRTLTALGWKNFVLSSTEDFGGYIQLEAVSEEQATRIYPDKIRMTIGSDTGKILSYDSTPYWLFHHERDLKPTIQSAEARNQLRSDMNAKESRLVVISMPGRQEALCYEFRGMKDTEEFLIYINAMNGTEEKIQRIIRTPRGEFLQ
jgi:spore germination protein